MLMSYESYVMENLDREKTEQVLKEAIKCCSESGFEACESFLEGFLYKYSHFLYTKRLKRICDDLDTATTGQFHYNSYPFGVKPAPTLPEYIGVCEGKTTFKSIMDDVTRQCEAVKRDLNEDDNKIILVFTDKWNTPEFRKRYAVPFINYAHKYNILFMFMLVTDFGVRDIPFLSWNHDIDKDIEVFLDNNDLDEIEEDDMTAEVKIYRIRNILCCGNHDICSFESKGRKIYNYSDAFKCEFDFDQLQYKYVAANNSSGTAKTGNISLKAFQEFALVIYNSIYSPFVRVQKPRKVNDSYDLKIVNVAGRHFEWYEAKKQVFKKLEEAFQILFKEVK